MASLLDIGRSAINAQREALSVTGQNIVNVNTEGYRRRDASLSEVFGVQSELTTLASQSGLGVQLGEVRRSFDAFLTESKRTATGRFEASDAFVTKLERLQNTILPNNGDLGVTMTAFFDVLSQLASRPGDLAPRAAVIEMGQTVSNAFNTTAMLLDDLGRGTMTEIETQMVQVNKTLDALGSLNGRLRASNLGGSPPNSLLDERDRLIDRLALLIPVNVSIGPRFDAELRLGSSEAGPVILSGEDARVLSLTKSDQGGISVRVGSGQTVSQLERGSIRGLVDAFGVTNRALTELDALARNFSVELNAQHALGIDLEGQLGKDLFAVAGFSPVASASNQGSAKITIGLVPGRADQLNTMSMTFDGTTNRWLVKDDAGALLGAGRSRIEIDGAVIEVDGQGKDGDRVTLVRDSGEASRMSFLLKRPEELAAASTVTIFPATTNLGSAVLNTMGADTKPIGIAPVTDVLANNLSPVAAQELLRGGVVGSIPRGTQEITLASFATQATAQVFAQDSADIGTVTFTVDNDTYSFNLSSNNSALNVSEWQSNAEIAQYLQLGVAKSDGSPAKTLAELGISVAGSESGLSFASDGTKALTGISATSNGSPAKALPTEFTAAQAASEIRIFTREGRQVSGPPLEASEVSRLITEENGFSVDAEYRADYNTVASGSSYRGMVVTQSRTGNDPQSRTGNDPLSSGLNTLFVSPAALSGSSGDSIVVGSAVNATKAQTITLSSDGRTSRAVSIPPAVDAAYIAERANASFAAIGVTATAMTAVKLALNEVGNSTGSVQFDLKGQNDSPIRVSADIAGGDLSQLVDAINRRKNDTGITAELSRSSGALTLIQRDGFDVALSDISVTGVGFDVTALDQSFQPLSSQSVPLGAGETTDRLNISGTVGFVSGSSFTIEMETFVGDKTKSKADSLPDSLVGGLVSRTFTSGGSEVGLTYQVDPKIDSAAANVDGTRVHAPSGRFMTELKLGDNDFTADVRTGSLLGSEPLAQQVAIETARQMRSTAPVPTLTGRPISLSAAPPIGTRAEFSLGGALYTLERVDGGDPTRLTALDFKITGPEEGRLVPNVVRDGNDNFILSLAAVDGQVSGLGPVPVSTTTASRFGLDAGNSTAMLQGRAISENATYPLTLSVSVGRGSDITDITVTVASIDGELTLTSDDDAKLTPIIIDVNGSSFLQLRAAEGAGPISVKGEGNPALGFKVGAADLTVEDGVLRARSTDGAAIDMKAGGVSAAGSYVKLTDIPDEDLIIIMGEDGAKRLGGEFEVGPPLKNADRKSELFRVEMIDDGTGRVELFDRDSGASIATRFSNGLVKFDVSGQTIELAGFAKTGDIFDLATGQRAAGDARNMDELASLGQQRSGFQSFQDQFRSIAAGVGSTLEAARFTLLSNEAVRDAAVETESEMSGVNLDEEAAKLMSQQQAYQAAARILQTAREMFDTLLQIA